MTQVYWKGKLWPWRKVSVSPLNSGLFYGENIFEAVPVYGRQALFLGDHLKRLKRGCDFLGWPSLPQAPFARAIQVFSKAMGAEGNFMIRFNLVQELDGQVNPRFFSGRPPTLFATTRPLRHDPREEAPCRGKVGVGSWTAADEKTQPNRFKISFYLTTRAVFRAHPEWDEILRLNRAGEVVDGGLSTPLWFDGKKVLIPPLSLGGLESVTRAKMMGLCGHLGIKVVERSWKVHDLFKKGELVFVGSGVGVMSPSSLLGRKINPANPLAALLWRRYRQWAGQKAGI